VIQRGEHLRFAREPGDTILVGGEQVGQDLIATLRLSWVSRAR
jgi:hypothetical protein